MILQPTEDAIARAVATLRDGGLVAMPTETVYGLAADARNPAAIASVFTLKGRPAHNPLIVHASSIEMARSVCAEWPQQAQSLADAFWPGPLTLVLRKEPDLPGAVTAGGPTVAVRVPDHPVALALIEAFGGPLVAPSANPSGRVSPTTAQHVASDFPDLLILDGGPCRGGIESTVVALREHGRPLILRRGLIGSFELADVLIWMSGKQQGSPRYADRAAGSQDPMPSPGLSLSHYAPRAPVRLVERDEPPAPPGVVRLELPPTPEEAAAWLYAALREADAGNPSEIWVEQPTDRQLGGKKGQLWEAVCDRLNRAAAKRGEE